MSEIKELEEGSVIGNYRVVRLLGQVIGGVYRVLRPLGQGSASAPSGT